MFSYQELKAELDKQRRRLEWVNNELEQEKSTRNRWPSELADFSNALNAQISHLEQSAKIAFAEENDWDSPC